MNLKNVLILVVLYGLGIGLVVVGASIFNALMLLGLLAALSIASGAVLRKERGLRSILLGGGIGCVFLIVLNFAVIRGHIEETIMANSQVLNGGVITSTVNQSVNNTVVGVLVSFAIHWFMLRERRLDPGQE